MIQSSKPLFKQAVLQSLPFSIPLKTRWGPISSGWYWLLMMPGWTYKYYGLSELSKPFLFFWFRIRGICVFLSCCCIQNLTEFLQQMLIDNFNLNCNFVFFCVYFPDTTPWSWEKNLLNRPTALWATSSACCLSLHRPSWPPRWKQVGRHKLQPTLTKFRAQGCPRSYARRQDIVCVSAKEDEKQYFYPELWHIVKQNHENCGGVGLRRGN